MRIALTVSLAVGLAACSSSHQKHAPSTATVDPSVAPAVSTIPGIDGAAARAVAALTDDSGITMDFVQNELIVVTDDTAALEAFVERWHGTIVQSTDSAATGLAGIPGFHLVRIDSAEADTDGLIEDLDSLTPDSRADLRFSNDEGQKLLAVAARENTLGLTAILNLVPRSATVASGSTHETNLGFAMTAMDFSSNVVTEEYDTDATKWSYMRRGGTQDINVADAWRALAATGRIGNRVSLAVIDGGMLSNSDVPSGAIWLSNAGSPNPGSCSGGTPCPWHGTGVTAAAMAVPDNDYGVAGPAGPVATPILVPMPGDLWSGIKFFLVDIPVTLVLRPKVVNISWGGRVPQYVNLLVNPPLDLVFGAIRNIWGTLVFAAAGNDGKDVDETDDLGIKKATWIPCQTSGVVCVGSMELDRTNISTFTNWANTSNKIDHTNTVDIFGPGYTWVNKAVGGSVLNEAEQVQGTSVSSPFVAGVAALIFAANPLLDANGVEAILMATAHTQTDNLVLRYVDAFAAVKQALAMDNIPPSITVAVEHDLFDSRAVTLTATVSDIEDDPDCCAVTWSSDVDGAMGSGKVLPFVFATGGSRRVVAQATDSQGAPRSAFVDVAIDVVHPTAAITAPEEGESPYTGIDYSLTGIAGEGGNDFCAIANGAVMTWESSVVGDIIGNIHACVTTIRFSGAGQHTVTWSVTDRFGVTSVDTLTLAAIVPDGLITTITQPANNGTVNQGDIQTLEGNIIGGVPPYTHRWLWNRDGCGEYEVPTTAPSVYPFPVPSVYELWDTSTGSYCTPNGTLTLEVTDSTAAVATDSVTFSVLVGPG